MKLFLSFTLAICAFSLHSQQNLSPEIKSQDLRFYLNYLASDSLKGRFPGDQEDKKAAAFIALAYKNAGLQLHNKTGLQPFNVIVRQELGKANALSLNNKRLLTGKDFFPFPFSKNGKVEGDIVFVGYGFDIKTDSFKWNDYENIDLKGKIALILRGTPDIKTHGELFDNYSDDIVKAINARDKGALAVIFVSVEKFDKSESFPKLNLKESSAGIPVIQIKREAINKALNSKVDSMEVRYTDNFKSLSFDTKIKASLVSDINRISSKTSNVIGVLQAPDTSANYIVIGAHYDHLGMGGIGSASRIQDTIAIHNGADDNASGVSALLELAAKLGKERKNLKQNIVFVAFGAEEMGILGSKYFVDHPPVPLKSIKAMINLDMVGRLKEDTLLQIGGTGTSKEANSIINNLNTKYNFKLRITPEGFGPSDHAAFYAKNIPVFFLTTGAHTDYHTPFDDRDKINFEGLEKVCLFTYDLIFDLASSPGLLTFQEAGPQKGSTGGRSYKVTLGIMPDINATTDNGLLVEFVTKGKPAYNAGMLKGDIIISVDGKPVKNIQDYMVRLSQLKTGQLVNVEVLRNNKKELLIIQL